MAIPNLKDKKVLITGAASGIGYQIALAFAKEGAFLIATDIQEAALEELKQAVSGTASGCITALLDVTDDAAWQALADSLATDGNSPDVLVNNAGIAYIGEFMDVTADMWRRTFEINVMAVMVGTRTFLPAMKASGTPKHIVNLSSVVSKCPIPALGAYSSSKAAVASMNDILTMELNDTLVGVSSIQPGFVSTPMLQNRSAFNGMSDARVEQLAKYYADNGCGPDVIAKDVVAAVKDGTYEVLTGPGAKSLAFMSRIFSKKAFQKKVLKLAYEVGYLVKGK